MRATSALLAAAMLQAAHAQSVTVIPPAIVPPNPAATGFPTPSGAVTLTSMYDDAKAWADLDLGDDAVFKLVPLEIQGIPTTVPSAQIAADSTLLYDCPLMSEGGCQAYLWYYVCPGKNCNPVYQGGLPGQLAATPGWVYTNCAPRFVTGIPPGYIHEMRGYRYRMAPGTSVSVYVPNKTEFVATGLEEGPVDCSQYTNSGQIACETATTNNRCVWDAAASECVETTCTRGGQGPAHLCLECPWEGIEDRPMSDGP